MSTILAEVDISGGWLALLFFTKVFLGWLPAIIAWVRHHPRRWWIYALVVLAGGGSFGWPPQLLGRIYFAITGPIKIGDTFSIEPPPMTDADWVLVGWSAVIWLISMFWATRKINLFEVHRSPL